ncbi:succinate dehydrogenase, cytochrome b556 subunit [Phaeobacter sp. 22II1-1F12B]|uniref:succinate dehydrogenase, cytochrome b556 subunit n=1 Tax=Phaeobacter sp. 22II1-1F12B TaxID=1317111 RepID=UPI000B525394|nr:succinate dehydrogenase, cytochrome b556 subunit [Phaeobacter sp. 22II1-1F12B]OWU79014.1 succinate dehydrogenase [Phaeobacter sp. 22II1-1F12B]
MADVNRGNRPLSPFMLGKYYRPQLNSVTSILTRITGNAMIVAALMIAWWLLAAATSEAAFNRADWFVTSFIGDLIMFFSVLGLWYHSLAGIRHLIWDQGLCLEMETADKLGWIVIGGSVVLTLLTVIIV